ncbi:type VI secretion system-associated FHA domain protein TagH [Mesorhizobium sp. WSM2240]|uniref:Type VI secretion system-associated FHA domain protein TagH n=3 Tax=unclassified Mesorhizobium TaxID=325217 RepID=A0AAU8DJW3_9HYPH
MNAPSAFGQEQEQKRFGESAMTITLTIVNVDLLPSGAPAFFQTANRSFQVGRDPNLDWTLQDPSRQISSRHCEVRFESGAYWLYDRSTNGVFVNGSTERMRGVHRLNNGDRLQIGPYVIDVMIAGDDGGLQIPPTVQGEPTAPAFDRPGAISASTAAKAGGVNEVSQRSMPVSGTQPALQPGSFLEAFCAGAGVPSDLFASRDQTELAYELGEFVKLTVENLSQMLRSRASAKAIIKSSSRTVIGSTDNNPLKHVPASAEAIESMFTRKRVGYLNARRSLEEAFKDLQTHEQATYAAMQKALAKLLDQLAPETIELAVKGSPFVPKKARAWDLFVERWEEQNAGENGMLDPFLAHFADAYDEATSKS